MANYSNGLPNTHFIYSFLHIGDVIYAGSNTGIYQSSDNGASWTTASTGLPAGSKIYTLLNVNGTLYAGGDKGIYQSRTYALQQI